MSPDACTGCRKNIDVQVSDDVYDFLNYAGYLLDQLERLEMNLPTYLEGFDTTLLIVVKNEKMKIENEIMAKKLEIDREK